MHVRITRGGSDPARFDEVVALAQEVAAAVERLPGCRSAVGAADRATGALAAVSSTWDSAEAAGFSRDALGELVPRLSALRVRLEPPEVYEVVA